MDIHRLTLPENRRPHQSCEEWLEVYMTVATGTELLPEATPVLVLQLSEASLCGLRFSGGS